MNPTASLQFARRANQQRLRPICWISTAVLAWFGVSTAATAATPPGRDVTSRFASVVNDPAAAVPHETPKPARRFADPAPPQVLPADTWEAAPPRPYERVTFHRSPQPLAAGAVTSDWPCFLGPTHDAVSSETRLLKKWPAGGPALVWELQKGNGYASPSVQGERLVFPHRVGDELLVDCLHAETGRQFWQFRIQTTYEDRYGYSNGPRSSPVIHDGRVYIYDVEGRLFCLQLQTGKLLWQRRLSEEFKVPQDFFGVGTTPLIEGKLLIINLGAPGGPCVIALDAETGKLVWGAGDRWGPSYSSPVPATIHGRRRVFVFAGGESRPPTGGLLALDPADGSIDFEFPWRSRSYESVNAACPVVVGNQVFISATYNTGSALLEVGPDFASKTVWTTGECGTHWNTAVHADGYLYAFDGRNEPDASLVCLELKTGTVLWRKVPEWEETVTIRGQQERLTMGTLRGCLLKVDSAYLCLGELGHLLWLDLSPQGYKQLDRTWLFAARETWALPVLSRGLLYVCQNSDDPFTRKPPRLLCYDLRGK